MKDTATWNQLADEIRELRAENDALRGRKKAERKLIYVASPFGGRQSNVDKAQRTIMRFVERYRGIDFISPIIAYGFCYDIYTYDDGIKQCLGLLDHCSELWICYDDGISKGVAIERAYALQHGIPIVENAEKLIGD